MCSMTITESTQAQVQANGWKLMYMQIQVSASKIKTTLLACSFLGRYAEAILSGS